MEPIVSVIVPVYNIRQYLKRCVDSIVNQTYSRLDIILVDDGSTDGSDEICDKYASEDKRIQAVHKVNGGLVSARKAGLLASSGEYVLPVDGDDWIAPDTVEKMINAMQKYHCDIVQSGCAYGYGNRYKHREDVLSEGFYDLTVFSPLFYSNLFMDSQRPGQRGIRSNLWSCLFKRSILYPLQMKVPNGIANGEDDACFYPYVLSVNSFYKLDASFFYITVRSNSLSRDGKFFNTEEVCVLEKMIRPYVECHRERDYLIKQFHRYLFHRFLYHAEKSWGCSCIYHKNYVFPFTELPSNCRVILYGAGKVGKSYMAQLKDMNNIHVTAWVDKDGYRDLYGYKIYTPQIVKNLTYDFILLAVLNDSTAEEMKAILIQCGVPECKILWKQPHISQMTFFSDL